ncbi:MAG TPA: RidA family protein [Dehalococcoidia bacterium]|nr:RidA family protein [Dehalococcoidia bacterium]
MSTQKVRRINPSTMNKPFGYTHVVEVVGPGRTVYIAGQTAVDGEGNVVGAGDLAAQTRQVFENLKAALGAVGADFSDVVKCNYYMTDISQLPILREIRANYLTGEAFPASTAVQVGGLARPEFMIEIEVVAVIP